MNIPTPGRFFLSLCIFLGLLGAAAAASSKSTMVTMGNNTFSITRKATSAFNRDVDVLRTEVQDDATKYCASVGKQLKVISLTDKRPMMTLGYVEAKIVFQALDANDPALTAVTAADASAPPPRERLSPNGDLYNDLLKLDDLRKRGILTDEEFQAEKKKVLSRSQ